MATFPYSKEISLKWKQCSLFDQLPRSQCGKGGEAIIDDRSVVPPKIFETSDIRFFKYKLLN